MTLYLSLIHILKSGERNQGDTGGSLFEAITKGFKERASAECQKLLETEQPLSIIDGHIIPALDTVGKKFEQKVLYLPQLLMSAEAAKSAFECIKEKMAGSGENKQKKIKIVIATVKGDIHDIGKNIVKTLLENYDFDVIDLGKDVDPEKVVEEVTKVKAPLCGLSALMTTTVPAMEQTIKLLKEAAPYCKIAVGGAVMTADYAERIGCLLYTSIMQGS